MYYSGKYIDTFELAFSQMIDCRNLLHVPYVDCSSLRCFGFSMGDDVREWFRPMNSLPDAIHALVEATGLTLYWKEITCIDELPNEVEMFILGPLKSGITAPELRDYYYWGEGRYLFIRGITDDAFEIFDPNGFAGLHLKRTQFRQIIQSQRMYCIWIVGDVRMGTPLDNQGILTRGFQYHEQICGLEYKEFYYASQKELAGRNSVIGMQYGVRNLLLQLDKVARLSDEVNKWDSKKNLQYLNAKQHLYRMGMQGNISVLPTLMKEMWSVLIDEE